MQDRLNQCLSIMIQCTQSDTLLIMVPNRALCGVGIPAGNMWGPPRGAVRGNYRGIICVAGGPGMNLWGTERCGDEPAGRRVVWGT